jgi:hypothetical protein
MAACAALGDTYGPLFAIIAAGYAIFQRVRRTQVSTELNAKKLENKALAQEIRALSTRPPASLSAVPVQLIYAPPQASIAPPPDVEPPDPDHVDPPIDER